jgi:hypothetical protein
MDQRVVFEPTRAPSWPRVAETLTGRGVAVQLRMIDGELAFPDETPPEAWRELRVGTPGGMVTLRREADGVTLVVWGNADKPLREEWNALTWAIAKLTGGRVRTGDGERSADEFAQHADMPAGVAEERT